MDASKGMVQWAKENAAASGVADGAVRWIVDDCIKFVQREIRRGNRYDIVILDPPSYALWCHRCVERQRWQFLNLTM